MSGTQTNLNANMNVNPAVRTHAPLGALKPAFFGAAAVVALAGMILGTGALTAPREARAMSSSAELFERQWRDAPAVSSEAKAGQVVAQGTARVSRTPDYADIVVGVETSGNTAGEAQSDCATKMEKVIAALKAMNLPGVELKTGAIELRPRYNDREVYNTGEPRKVLGYVAVNTLRVRTTDLKAVARVIDASLTQGANRVDSVGFAIREAMQAREEALKLATQAAKRKAGVMAEALGQGLGRVVIISESSREGGWNRTAQYANSFKSEQGQAGEDSVEAGTIDVTVDVSITFELSEPRGNQAPNAREKNDNKPGTNENTVGGTGGGGKR